MAPLTLCSGTSVEVGVVSGTESDGRINMRVTLHSSTIPTAGVTFLYKLSLLGEWQEDAVLLWSDNGVVAGNKLLRLPCSPTGSETIFVWDHAANGLAAGMRCQVKATIIPTVSAICRSDRVSTIETASGTARTIDKMVEGVVLCVDDEGGLVLADDHRVYRRGVGGEEVELAPWLASPKDACPTGRGSCLILDGDGTILEVGNDGTLIASASVAGMVSGDPGINCDQITGNILLTGGDVPKVYELSWAPSSYGTIMWEYGQLTPGSGAGFLDHPRHASYGDGIEFVLICDHDNNRIVSIDRSGVPQVVTNITSVTVGIETLDLSGPIRCAQAGNSILVCEGEGERVYFSTSPSLHPTMARSGMAAASGKDALEQYSGLKFVPILRGVK